MSADKIDYNASILAHIAIAKKEKNAEKLVYYTNALAFKAVAAFSEFKGAWCYDYWKRDNKAKIEEAEADFKRFAYLSN